jgi:hypothetical protein
MLQVKKHLQRRRSAEKHGEAGKLKDAVITEVHINEGVEEKDFR